MSAPVDGTGAVEPLLGQVEPVPGGGGPAGFLDAVRSGGERQEDGGEFDRGDRVYLDDNHVTATYLNTMSSMVEQAIDSALGWRQPETPM